MEFMRNRKATHFTQQILKAKEHLLISPNKNLKGSSCNSKTTFLFTQDDIIECVALKLIQDQGFTTTRTRSTDDQKCFSLQFNFLALEI